MRQELTAPACWLQRQLRQHVAHVDVGVVPVDGCRMQQTHDGRGALARAQAPGEEPVLPSQRNRADLVFNSVVVDGHPFENLDFIDRLLRKVKLSSAQ